MKTGSKKSTITIITLACLLAVAVASTVILAAFSAVRTSTTTITFANGLTMQLAPKTSGTTANIKITQPDTATNSGEFSYEVGVLNENSFTGYEEPVTLDGIVATLNKDGWVAYQITLTENNSAIGGSWANDNGEVTFTPTATANDDSDEWTAVLTAPSSGVSISVNNNVVTVTFTSMWSGATLTTELFSSIVIDGTTTGNVNALAGRSIVADFVIKADTSDGIGASNDQNPITFA